MMSPSEKRKDEMYKAYMEFFDLAEKNRRWHPLHDLEWEYLETPKNSQDIRNGEGIAADEEMAICLESFCAVELFIPDYTAAGLNMTRDIFGQSWFHLSWGYEESKHAMSFRKYLIDSGLRTEQQYLDFESRVLEKKWTTPFRTYRQMACYGALQEIATYLIYQQQHRRQEQSGNPLLKQIFYYISRDEAAHTALYRKFLAYEFSEDREGTEEDLAYVISCFQMPGVEVLPDYEERVKTDGVGITPASFMENGVMKTLRYYGMDRRSMTRALHRYRNGRMKTQEPELAMPKAAAAVN